MAVRSLSKVKQQLCVLVPGRVTARVRVAIMYGTIILAIGITAKLVFNYWHQSCQEQEHGHKEDWT